MGSDPLLKMSQRSHSSFTLNHILTAFLLSFAIIYEALGQTTTPPGGKPNLMDSVQGPVAVIQGENAPLTCVVRNLGDANTVVWKKWESGKSGPKILTAGETRVTSDERMKIIHDQGGDVWVLAIRDSKPSDSGLYICEVNTNPVLRSFHNLTVISLDISPPHNNETSSFTLPPPNADLPFLEFPESYLSYKGQGTIAGHNYTSCCVSQNVSRSCLGFCTLQSILEGSTGEPSACENEFPRIVKCMADGRDHIPCCVREGVPDICQDLCRGEYTIVTDNVKTHFSCPTFIERTLACIADGVEILPSEPLKLETMAISQSAINVSWLPPTKNADTITEYVVNVTTLRSFDAPFTGLGYGDSASIQGSSTPNLTVSSTSTSISVKGGSHGIDISSEEKVEASMRQIKVHGDLHSVLITQLQPFTMYEISVTGFNIHGRSLPSIKIRTLTLAPGILRPNSTSPPTLPDIKTCCINSGVNSESCVNKLCDPKKTTSLEIPDLMICAPWTPQVFKCLADGKDHTPCCRQRGIPQPCLDLCFGNVTKLDYHYFKCLRYMSEYSNCLMAGYGVLPSAPTKVRVSNVNWDFAIVHWSPPSTLTETVTGYNIHYRALGTYENLYVHINNIHAPYILENLYANSEYEVYVEAVNEHGASEGSQRVVFRTTSQALANAKLEANTDLYNETNCCVSAGLSLTCMPLCSYEASMSDIRTLAFACAAEFHTILRCAAGGRDHRDCCAKRGVTDVCVDVCGARVPNSLKAMAENCLPFIGNIIQCFDEGTELIPAPVEEFHAFLVTDSSVGLAWDAPPGYNVTQYQVFYELQAPSGDGISSKPAYRKSVNVTETSTEIQGLDKESTYKFYAMSQNEHGSSVPSAMVLVKVSSQDFDGSKVAGIVSAPHGLVVAGHGATWVQIVWQPPAIAHPTDKLSYKIHHKGVKETEYLVNSSSVNSITLDGLVPNSQYIVYANAANDKGESQPSETLIAWTDPAHSPFVEPPRIQPMNLLIEGGSMTIVCVALGDPLPTISLYINGKLVKTLKNRHLTATVDNITREMDIVSCYADNGFGSPMQAARRIQVSHLPSLYGPEMTYVVLGDSATIECSVVSFPEAKVGFWKSSRDRIPIVNGGNIRIEHVEDTPMPLLDEPPKVKTILTILNFTEGDIGNYSCHAENAIGETLKTFTVRKMDLKDSSINITECCIKEKVSAGCMDSCSIFTEVESILDKPQCLPDFDKLIKCSADGRDHRACCSNWAVPKRCLDLCRGEPVQNADLCVLQSSKHIFNCFKENRDKLPGPPQNVRIEVLSDNDVKVVWDVPATNPHTATLYRVFWRQVGQKLSERADTQSTSLKIANLKAGVQYEAVIKAGNNRGTSVLTEPLAFTTENNFIASASTSGGSNVGLGFGIAFLVMLICGGVVGAAWFIRNHKQFGLKPPGGAIAFENPSYIRETNPDVHMNGDGPSVPSVSNGVIANGWHTETLHPHNEVAPTLYEELRLGSDGVGFRRLKP